MWVLVAQHWSMLFRWPNLRLALHVLPHDQKYSFIILVRSCQQEFLFFNQLSHRGNLQLLIEIYEEGLARMQGKFVPIGMLRFSKLILSLFSISRLRNAVQLTEANMIHHV